MLTSIGLGGAPKKAAFENGTAVEAKVKGWKQHYAGTITAFDGKSGTYSVLFADGDSKTGVKGFNIRGPAKKETFTAPDGQVFDSKNAYRKYLSENFYSFHDAAGQTLAKKEGDIAGQTFNLRDLKDCEVQLMDHADQVLVDRVEGCKVLIGPSSESVFVRNAKNCHFFIACKQFRCRDCEDCTVSLYSKTEPVVETSSRMRFYPYAAAYPNQAAHFAKANLQPAHNHWCNVFDFNKGDARIPEPHWELLADNGDNWVQWAPVPDGAENPVPKDARATVLPKESGFALGTSQEEASKAHEAAAAPAAPAPVDAQQAQQAEQAQHAAKAATPEVEAEADAADAPAAPAAAAAPAPAVLQPSIDSELLAQISGTGGANVNVKTESAGAVLLVGGERTAALARALAGAGTVVAVAGPAGPRLALALKNQVVAVSLEDADWRDAVAKAFPANPLHSAVVLAPEKSNQSGEPGEPAEPTAEPGNSAELTRLATTLMSQLDGGSIHIELDPAASKGLFADLQKACPENKIFSFQAITI